MGSCAGKRRGAGLPPAHPSSSASPRPTFCTPLNRRRTAAAAASRSLSVPAGSTALWQRSVLSPSLCDAAARSTSWRLKEGTLRVLSALLSRFGSGRSMNSFKLLRDDEEAMQNAEAPHPWRAGGHVGSMMRHPLLLPTSTTPPGPLFPTHTPMSLALSITCGHRGMQCCCKRAALRCAASRGLHAPQHRHAHRLVLQRDRRAADLGHPAVQPRAQALDLRGQAGGESHVT